MMALMSGTYRRSSGASADGEEPQPTFFRLNQIVYDNLKAYSNASHSSMNAVANEVFATFLGQPEVQQILATTTRSLDSEKNSEKLEAVARRLSGKDT